MNILELEKPDDIHKILKKYRKSSKYKFRGQSNAEWKLVPKAGRIGFASVNDVNIFKNWKRRAKLYVQDNAYTNWDYLAIAQHTGLPTRLLDWTHNPLIATFFACIENPEFDGAIYVIKPWGGFQPEHFPDPFDTDIERVCLILPSTPTQRIANQFGHFTIHNKPDLELNESTLHEIEYLEKIIIPKEKKDEVAFLLNQYGVNFLTIFPDLEGLSKHLCWFAQNYKYWDDTINED